MIQALLEYAESRALAAAPGFSYKDVEWIIDSSSTSKTATLVTAGTGTRGKRFYAPDLTQPEMKALGAREGAAAHFLVAPLSHWLGIAKDEKDQPTEAKRRQTLLNLLNDCSTLAPACGELRDLLSSDSIVNALIEQIKRPGSKAKLTDKATPRLDGCLFVKDEDWQRWWASFVDKNDWPSWWATFRAGLQKRGAVGETPSFASGALVKPAKTLGKLAKLTGVGLSQPQAPIITFDKPAFESYELSQGANAAMSDEEAKVCVTALDDLLERSVIYSWKRPKPKQPKQLAREFAKLGGARILYWYSGPAEAVKHVEEELDVPGLGLGSVPPREPVKDEEGADRVLIESRLRSAINQIKSGETSVPVGDVKFHLIALSGAGGRVMTRDYLQSSLRDIAEAAEKWFSDLSLATYRGGPSQDPKLEQVLTCPLRPRGDQDYLKWVTPVGAWRQQLWRAALLGGRIPESAAAKALLAFNSTVVSGDLTDSEKGDRARAHARLRLALVKTYLIRNKGVPMQPALDPEHPSPAYHCGRLLAVYDKVQRVALGDVGAGVVQRNYGGAIVNPSGVLGRLSTLVTKHLDKIGGGLEHTYEAKIAEIHNGIKETYPAALDQEGQALFALGFWHQIASDNAEKAKNTAAKKARESANDAPKEEEEGL